MFLIGLIIGALSGGTIGFATMALCQSSKYRDNTLSANLAGSKNKCGVDRTDLTK